MADVDHRQAAQNQGDGGMEDPDYIEWKTVVAVVDK
jgi:hypothetical protein